ncbi:MAG: DNA repair protein RadA, partial [Bacteroidales bacterium]|nr:DNA repair protein RadA [Bacteroidales bacterium]
MAATGKEKTVFFCTSCGNESPKWMGRCPACGEWNTMVEKTVATGAPKRNAVAASRSAGQSPRQLREVGSAQERRMSLGNGEVDRLLGGGIVEGSLILIGGEPGIGKSTLSIQIPLGCPGIKTLYVSGEESPRQVKMRADRLGGDDSNIYIYSETN